MLKLTNPRLRRLNVVVNSFHSGVSNTSEKFSRTPEVSFSEIVSKPRMFFEKLIRAITLKQLQGFANRNSWRKFNKQVDVVCPNIEFINLKSSSISNLSQEEFTIHPQPIKLEGISCIFNFPYKVEGILPEAMLPRFQIHFNSPEYSSNYIQFIFEEPSISAFPNNSEEKLNLMENGDSSQNLKVWVPSP